MLLGKLYAILIYGEDGARKKTFSLPVTWCIDIVIVIWLLFMYATWGVAAHTSDSGDLLIAIFVTFSVPFVFYRIGKWGRNQVQKEKEEAARKYRELQQGFVSKNETGTENSAAAGTHERNGNTAQAVSADEPKNKKVAIVDGRIVCPKCNTEQSGTRKVCFHCGCRFDLVSEDQLKEETSKQNEDQDPAALAAGSAAADDTPHTPEAEQETDPEQVTENKLQELTKAAKELAYISEEVRKRCDDLLSTAKELDKEICQKELPEEEKLKIRERIFGIVREGAVRLKERSSYLSNAKDLIQSMKLYYWDVPSISKQAQEDEDALNRLIQNREHWKLEQQQEEQQRQRNKRRIIIGLTIVAVCWLLRAMLFRDFY